MTSQERYLILHPEAELANMDLLWAMGKKKKLPLKQAGSTLPLVSKGQLIAGALQHSGFFISYLCFFSTHLFHSIP